MYNSFKDRYAVVTGAAQGIGYAIAERFVKENIAGIAILDWNSDAIKNTAEKLSKLSDSKILALQCDVSDYQAVSRVMAEVEETFGRIDILVNNAGITRDAIFHKMTPEQWNAVINVNLNGTFNCTSAVIKGMRDRCYGKIVNMASVAAYGSVGQSNYCATKAAMIALTKSLAKEGARKGITVNAIAPDMIDTPMMNAIPPHVMERNLKNCPMERMGKPEEVAALVAWLSSDESSYISGTCIDCNGAIRT
ncbi:MAG: 3-oxoacyl-ACP reductase FabG [Christensenellaceae bacterium]|nr:3-oxoacyl-ACP reductase FabG [Christensenellaceae bacterium]